MIKKKDYHRCILKCLGHSSLPSLPPWMQILVLLSWSAGVGWLSVSRCPLSFSYHNSFACCAVLKTANRLRSKDEYCAEMGIRAVWKWPPIGPGTQWSLCEDSPDLELCCPLTSCVSSLGWKPQEHIGPAFRYCIS